MGAAAIEWDEKERRAVLRPTGGIDRPHARALWSDASRILEEKSPARLVLDLHALDRIDGTGVALVRELEERCRRRGSEFSIEGAAPPVTAFLEFVRGRAQAPQPARKRQGGRAARLSQRIESWGHRLREMLEYVGRLAESAAFLATHPHKLRWRDLLYQVQKAGAEGMWLLIGLSLLLGVIMAFQGLTGTHGFGSPLLVADVVTLSTTREMAPLLTGVIVTGRSGAAIAAEIGSMKIHEEIDALSVMGFDVTRFLVVPRALALAISTPLLTLLSIGAGILGGASVAVFVAHLTPAGYFNEVQHAISGTQIASALVKGTAFGIAIGTIGCFQGLQAGKAAEDVGRQTTAAVVRSILLIIFADAFFSILSQVYGW